MMKVITVQKDLKQIHLSANHKTNNYLEEEWFGI